MEIQMYKVRCAPKIDGIMLSHRHWLHVSAGNTCTYVIWKKHHYCPNSVTSVCVQNRSRSHGVCRLCPDTPEYLKKCP